MSLLCVGSEIFVKGIFLQIRVEEEGEIRKRSPLWCFRRNNGITEGFYNKMEMISRRAFGFKNFDNHRLRVRACCN